MFNTIEEFFEEYFPEYDVSYNINKMFLTKMYYPYSIYVKSKDERNYSIRFANICIKIDLDRGIDKEQEQLIDNIKHVYDDVLVNNTRRFISVDIGNLRLITSVIFDFKTKRFESVIYDISNLDTFFTNSFLYKVLKRIEGSNNQYETLQEIYNKYFAERHKYIDKVIEHFYITRCIKKDTNEPKPYIIIENITFDNVINFQKYLRWNKVTTKHFKQLKKYFTFYFINRVVSYFNMMARKFDLPVIKISELNTSNISGEINDRDLKACLNMLKININISRIIENRNKNNKNVIDEIEKYIPIVL